MTNRRLVRIIASLAAGSIGVAIGLYLGWFAAAGLQAARIFATRNQLSLGAIALITETVRWAFIGLIGGSGLAFTVVNQRRLVFILASILGFALGGALTALLVFGNLNRNAASATLGVPLGGALAGLLSGLGARLGIRSVLMLIVTALAMVIGGLFIDPRSPGILPSPLRLGLTDWIALLAPGALIGAALAVLAPDNGDAPSPR